MSDNSSDNDSNFDQYEPEPEPELFECEVCEHEFKTQKMLDRHKKKKIPCKRKVRNCTYCNSKHNSRDEYEKHLEKCDIRLETLKKRREEIEKARLERKREREMRQQANNGSTVINTSNMPDLSNVFDNDFFRNCGGGNGATNVIRINGSELLDNEDVGESTRALMKLCLNPNIKQMDSKVLGDSIQKYVNNIVRYSLMNKK
jgi:hypothetical protein